MSDVVFSPDSYARAGQAFTDDGDALAQAASRLLGGMDMGALGCNNNGTLADTAFGIVFPIALQAMQETAAGLGRGFSIVGEGLANTAHAYGNVEDVNTQAANDSGTV